jgi:hypothetical protein
VVLVQRDRVEAEGLAEAQLAGEALVQLMAALGIEERVGEIDPDRLVLVGVLRDVDVVVVVEEVELDVVEDAGHGTSPPRDHHLQPGPAAVRSAHSCTSRDRAGYTLEPCS